MCNEGAALVYRCAKRLSEPTSEIRGAKADEITLTPLELIDRTATPVPPKRLAAHYLSAVLIACCLSTTGVSNRVVLMRKFQDAVAFSTSKRWHSLLYAVDFPFRSTRSSYGAWRATPWLEVGVALTGGLTLLR